MILATSKPPIEGLRGSKTNEGVKKMLMYRRAKPAFKGPAVRSCSQKMSLMISVLTGTSMTLTSCLVLLSPMIKSHAIRPKKSSIMQETEAGKVTELMPMRLETPKQARRIRMIPVGT